VPHTDSKTRNHVLFGGDGFTDDYWESCTGTKTSSIVTAISLRNE